jgi:hypothetical protein
MAINITEEPGYQRDVVVSYPASPVSGGVCLYGNLAGIALTDERTDGGTTVDFGPFVVDISVTDSETGGIAKGDSIFASQATPIVMSNDSTGVFFGYADEVISDGETDTIKVIHPPMIGGVLGSGTIGATQLASNAVTTAKILASNVTTAKIADANVTNAKLATDCVKVAEVALTAGAADAFCLAWQNPESSAIIVTRILVDVTTAGGTATAVLNFGSAASATTASDNLIDGVDANATATYDNLLAADAGSNGKTSQKLDANGGTTDYITGQIKTEAASNLVGNAYIFYRGV